MMQVMTDIGRNFMLKHLNDEHISDSRSLACSTSTPRRMKSISGRNLALASQLPIMALRCVVKRRDPWCGSY